MPAYAERSFASRMGAMGDASEDAFFEQYPNSVRFGLNRPPIYMGKLPPEVRYTPDYLMADTLVECQGCGRDKTIKLKVEKYVALCHWANLMPLHLWVWDMKIGSLHPWDDVVSIIGTGRAPLASFNEGKTYFGLHLKELRANAKT